MTDSRQPTPTKPKKPSADPQKAAKPPGAFEPPDESHWHRLISEAAYFRAQQRDFAAGGELEDWLAAELEVKDALASRR